ncbi:MAG: hypothetical protein RLZZ546_3399 [Bacteroidota bacterium]|jgi:hypothetical protein
MTKIGIIELSRHYEVLRTYALKMKQEGNTVILFVTENVYEALYKILEKQNFEWHIVDLSLGYKKGILDHYVSLNECDEIICCTQEDIFGQVITKEWEPKTTMVLHELHRNFDVFANFNWRGDVMLYLKFLHLILTGYFTKRKRALKKFDFIGVASEGMKQYAEKKYKVSNIRVLPFYFNEYKSEIHKRENLCIAVIPGTFDNTSRDYESIVQLLSKSIPKINKKLQLILLGQYVKNKHNEKIKKALMDMQGEKFELVSYNNNIQLQMYDETILASDFLILPLKSQWVSNTIIRTADKSYVSGNVGDVMRYGIPALITSLHPYNESITPYVTEYDISSKGIAIVIDYINEQKYNMIKEKQIKE